MIKLLIEILLGILILGTGMLLVQFWVSLFGARRQWIRSRDEYERMKADTSSWMKEEFAEQKAAVNSSIRQTSGRIIPK